jgi:hypothetical protein
VAAAAASAGLDAGEGVSECGLAAEQRRDVTRGSGMRLEERERREGGRERERERERDAARSRIHPEPLSLFLSLRLSTLTSFLTLSPSLPLSHSLNEAPTTL